MLAFQRDIGFQVPDLEKCNPVFLPRFFLSGDGTGFFQPFERSCCPCQQRHAKLTIQLAGEKCQKNEGFGLNRKTSDRPEIAGRSMNIVKGGRELRVPLAGPVSSACQPPPTRLPSRPAVASSLRICSPYGNCRKTGTSGRWMPSAPLPVPAHT